MLPDVYFRLTAAETYTIIQGWIWNRDLRSSDFRELFTLQYNQFAKKGSSRSSTALWPLKSIDKRFNRFETASEEYEWRGKMLDYGAKFFN